MLNHTAGVRDDNADAGISMSRETMNKILLREETLKQAQDKGEVQITGNAQKVDELLGCLDKFDFWFNIVTP